MFEYVGNTKYGEMYVQFNRGLGRYAVFLGDVLVYSNNDKEQAISYVKEIEKQ